MNSGLKSIETDAARFGFKKVRWNAENPHAVAWEIACGQCGAKHKAAWGPDTSPDLMVRNMRRKGWNVRDGKPPQCGSCSKPIVVNKTELKPMSQPAPGGASIPPVAPKIQRQIFSLLEDHFDDAKRIYRVGWSDDHVAKQVGTTTAIVERLRREAFGELAEDPKISTLRDDMEILRMEWEEWNKGMGQKFRDMQARFEALAMRSR